MGNYEKELLLLAWENYRRTGKKQYSFLLRSSKTAVDYLNAARTLEHLGYIVTLSSNVSLRELRIPEDTNLIFRLTHEGIEAAAALKAE